MVVRWGISFNRGTLGSLPDGRGMLWDLTSFYCQWQVSNSELGIGTSCNLELSEPGIECNVVGTTLECTFYATVQSFYETSVSKMLG